jgi:acetyltransferase-like isoleucine patch superfamily enzyme
MILKRIYNYLERLYVEKSGTEVQIRYLRKKGMKIGENCRLGGLTYTNEAYLINIGNHVATADGVVFITHDAGLWCFSEQTPEDDVFGKIVIGNNVMIGRNCIFLPNTTVGNNCIIGAGSVVRGKFPDNSVIIGNPAQVVSTMNIQKLLYNQNPGRLKTAKLTDKQKEPIVKKHFGII